MNKTLENKLEITETIIRNHYNRTIFYLKPAGEDCCKGVLQDKENYVCMKANIMMSRRYPIDCKYLEPNYDFPDLTQCTYDLRK